MPLNSDPRGNVIRRWRLPVNGFDNTVKKWYYFVEILRP